MYELKKIGKVFTCKSVGTGPSSYKKRIYRAATSQRLRNTAIEDPRRGVHTVYQELVCETILDVCTILDVRTS